MNRLFVRIGQHYRSTRGCERFRRREAQPRSRTGNQRNLLFKGYIHIALLIQSRFKLWLTWAFLEYILGDRHRREDVGPPRIESQMRDGLGSLGLSQAVIHRPVEMRRKLRRLPVGNQRADRDEAAIPRCQVWAEP